MARQLMDGKTVKKVRPRRTVDYGGPLGRWALVRLPFVCRLIYRSTFCVIATEVAAQLNIRTVFEACTSVYH